MTCLAALEVTLRRFGHASAPGAGVEAALAVWDGGRTATGAHS
jgi:phage gp45-like